MERAKRSILIALLLSCCSGSALGADERIPTKFIQQVLSLSHRDWFQALYEGRTAIDKSFFDLCEARIEHSLKIQEIGDAWEFALLCDRATEVLGSRGKYRTRVIRVLVATGKRAAARELLDEMVSISPENIEAKYLNALLLETEGRFSEAYSSFLEAAEAGFEATDCGIRMAKLRRLIAQDSQPPSQPFLSPPFPRKELPGWATPSGRDSVAWTLCREGDFFRSRGEFVKAQGAYEKALSQDPLLPEGNVSLGILLYDLNLPDAAIKHLSVAVSLDSLNGDAWLYLGYAYEARFSFSLSEEDLRRAARAYQSGAIVDLQNAHFRAGLDRVNNKRVCLGLHPHCRLEPIRDQE